MRELDQSLAGLLESFNLVWRRCCHFFFLFYVLALAPGSGSWLLGSSVVVKRRAEVEVEEIHRRAYIRALITDSSNYGLKTGDLT